MGNSQGAVNVLRITTVQEGEKNIRVHLCGQFTGEYVTELERTLASECAGAQGVALDLTNVTFVDRNAMVFLCTAKSNNVSIENIPSYVQRWIQQERRCGPTADDPQNPRPKEG